MIFVSISSAAFVLRKRGKIYIEDQKGERWDVTQAKSIGFKPELFQYGIGKNAFIPLDDSNLSDNTSSVTSNLRIIGFHQQFDFMKVAPINAKPFTKPFNI